MMTNQITQLHNSVYKQSGCKNIWCLLFCNGHLYIFWAELIDQLRNFVHLRISSAELTTANCELAKSFDISINIYKAVRYWVQVAFQLPRFRARIVRKHRKCVCKPRVPAYSLVSYNVCICICFGCGMEWCRFYIFLIFIKFLRQFAETLETFSLETDTETASSETETLSGSRDSRETETPRLRDRERIPVEIWQSLTHIEFYKLCIMTFLSPSYKSTHPHHS